MKHSSAVRILTWSRRLRCGGNSQKSCGTLSLLSPSWVPCRFWGRRSIVSPGLAPQSGSTSAPCHCPPEWAPVMATSSLKSYRGGKSYKVGWSAIDRLMCKYPRAHTLPHTPEGHVCHCHPQVLTLPSGDKLPVTRPPHRLPISVWICENKRKGWAWWCANTDGHWWPGYDQNSSTKNKCLNFSWTRAFTWFQLLKQTYSPLSNHLIFLLSGYRETAVQKNIQLIHRSQKHGCTFMPKISTYTQHKVVLRTFGPLFSFYCNALSISTLKC